MVVMSSTTTWTGTIGGTSCCRNGRTLKPVWIDFARRVTRYRTRYHLRKNALQNALQNALVTRIHKVLYLYVQYVQVQIVQTIRVTNALVTALPMTPRLSGPRDFWNISKPATPKRRTARGCFDGSPRWISTAPASWSRPGTMPT